MNNQIPQKAKEELTSRGKLRVGVNLGNFLLVNKDPATGELHGVVPDLAAELARRLGTTVELISYPGAGEVADAATTDAWDVGFIGAEPQRASVIEFTLAYVEIPATYLVPAGSPIRSLEEVDRPGVRVATAARSAYDLYLSRNLKKAKIERAPTSPAVVDYFLANKLDVAAGVKQQLEMDAKRLPGLRLLPGRFMVINQAMGMTRGKEAGAKYLTAFVEEMKASGFVADGLRRHKIEGAAVAPPGGAP